MGCGQGFTNGMASSFVVLLILTMLVGACGVKTCEYAASKVDVDVRWAEEEKE
jgi:hypothetical protein